MKWLEQKSAEAKVNIEKRAAETPQKVFLPGMNELMRAMPNHIGRSSLFAPVARGRKKLHDNTLLISRGDAEIRFSGKQLDEAQADVWMQVMYLAVNQPLGEVVTINRAAFLRAIGRCAGGYEYKWLNQAMKDLSFAMLSIEVKKVDGKPKLSIGATRVLHMITGFDYDPSSETYFIRIDPRWAAMYANSEYALIDWEVRCQFEQGQDMAKALQRLMATSSDVVQRYKLEWLKEKMVYSSPMRKFKEALKSALRELERLEVIQEGKIEESTRSQAQVVLWLPPKKPRLQRPEK